MKTTSLQTAILCIGVVSFSFIGYFAMFELEGCKGLTSEMASLEKVSTARNGVSMCGEIQRYQKHGALASGETTFFMDLKPIEMFKAFNELRKEVM